MKIYIADFETHPFDNSKTENYQIKSRFVCFLEIFTNEKLFFNIEKEGTDKLKEFIYSLCSLNNPTRIYFHNLKFDLAFLYSDLPKDYKYRLIQSGSKIINFKIFKEYKRYKNNGLFRIEKKTLLDIRDSLVLFVSSLEKLGISVNLPKMNQDYFSETIDNKYIEYCYNDCQIVQKALFKLVDFCKIHFDYDLDLKNIPLTISSLSKRLFHYVLVRKFGKLILKDLYHHSIKDYEVELRNYYFGGRVEVFNFNRCLNGYYNDVNSEFPSIMYDYLFPIPPYSKKIFYDLNIAFNEYTNNFNAFSFLCEINEVFDIPLIPTRFLDNKKIEKIIYGKGIKTCFLFRQELDYLLKNNIEVRITEIYYCKKYLPIFREYISILYNIKKSFGVDSFEYYFCKILMNALYGKFAEKYEKELIEILQEIDYSKINESNYEFNSKGYIKRDIEIHDKIKVNIVFSMMITALARLKLYNYIIKEKNPIYSDTDSIVSHNLIENSNELGKMKPEFSFTQFQALGCKEYIIERYEKNKLSHFVKMKGFGKIKSESFNSFIADYREGKKQNRMIGFLESFVRDLPFNTILVFDKYKTSTYDKRFINNDLTTKAFHLQNDDFNEMIKNNEKMIDKIIKSYSGQ